MTRFDRIRERAARRKGGDTALKKLLGAKPDNRKVAKVSDDRILSAMAERIFCAGFVWKVIENKWPGFEDAFLGFEPKALLFQPEDFWGDLTSDSRIVRNGQKIIRSGKTPCWSRRSLKNTAASASSSRVGRPTTRSA